MKKFAFLAILVALIGSCNKVKFTEKPFLKMSVGATNYEYNPDQIEAGIIKAADQIENRKVFYVRTGGTSLAPKPVFFVQSHTNIPLN